mgnify:FL=1
MLLLANTINTLNEKELKYKVSNEGSDVTIVFGLIMKGQKSAAVLTPGDETIKVKIQKTEKADKEVVSLKEITGDEFPAFIDNILELKALYEREAQLIKMLTE